MQELQVLCYRLIASLSHPDVRVGVNVEMPKSCLLKRGQGLASHGNCRIDVQANRQESEAEETGISSEANPPNDTSCGSTDWQGLPGRGDRSKTGICRPVI